MPRPYLLAEVHWPAPRDTPYDVAVLPWGATEAHNYHLPYATDVIECDHVAAEAARKAWNAGTRVAVLPTVPFGVNTGQLAIPLCLNLMPSTQAAILRDLIDAARRAGIRRFVVLNGHGGNHFRQMLRELGTRFPDVFLCTLNWYEAADAQAFFDTPGDHAGELETSVVLHAAPHLVKPLGEAGSGASRGFALPGLRDGWVWAERQWHRVTDDTGVGDPKAASAEKGARFVDAATTNIAGFLTALARADVDDLYERG